MQILQIKTFIVILKQYFIDVYASNIIKLIRSAKNL